MISSTYKIDLSNISHDGGYCTLFEIKDYADLGFKEFISKKRAVYARKVQIRLSRYNLAPKVYSKICRVGYDKLFPGMRSGWGYITELAKATNKKLKLYKIQKLVDDILDKTQLKFWDCHWENIGYVVRNKKRVLVCIDTGKETWDGYANYFGNSDPGPKCSYCSRYICKCLGD